MRDALTDTAYVLRAELSGAGPGARRAGGRRRGVLMVRAERGEEAKGVDRWEFRCGVLYRGVRLPASADEEYIRAVYRGGILEVAVPLMASERAGRQIAVTAAG